MLIESFNRLAVGVRDDYLAEVFPQRLENGTRLRIGPLIQNLTQVSQTIYTGHEHPQPRVFLDLILDPGGPVYQHVLGPGTDERRSDLRFLIAGYTGIRHQDIDIAKPVSHKLAHLGHFIGYVGLREATTDLA